MSSEQLSETGVQGFLALYPFYDKNILIFMRIFFSFLLMGILFFSGGCASITGRAYPLVSDEAGRLLSILENQNNDMRTFKGMGKIEFQNKETRQTSRAAWMGKIPDKLRFGLLSISGQPAVSFSSDGRYFYALSHVESKFYKTRSSDPSLKRLLLISIRNQAVIQLLTGRIPVHDYYKAEVETEEKGCVLILKNTWGSIVEKIWFSENYDVYKLQMLNTMGNITYQVEFGKIRNISGYRIPFSISISNDEARASLRIDRYWADTPVSASAFVLSEPE